MIIWINGPFGGGKTTLASLLHENLPESIIFDPEEIGFVWRKALGDHPTRTTDFQDYPAWRTLTAAYATELDHHTHGGSVIAPMTLVNEQYAREIFTSLHGDGVDLHHLVLHADTLTIRGRIEESQEFPGDEERSEQVRVFRRRRLADYERAYATWLQNQAEVIDTTTLTPLQVADQALALLKRS
ncbi:AAA family ATPase [Streptomyces sp. NPDC018029]|uniref:AAA family ATPase n=1 Tax=Streptomyces sp. NPDC018029 TaxID=3365032 RepID=UPI00378A41BC